MAGTGTGLPTPTCAFPLYGLNLDMITPLGKVALAFAAAPYSQGMVVESAIGPSVPVGLTRANSVGLGCPSAVPPGAAGSAPGCTNAGGHR